MVMHACPQVSLNATADNHPFISYISTTWQDLPARVCPRHTRNQTQGHSVTHSARTCQSVPRQRKHLRFVQAVATQGRLAQAGT